MNNLSRRSFIKNILAYVFGGGAAVAAAGKLSASPGPGYMTNKGNLKMKTTAINSKSGPDAAGSYSQAILLEEAQQLLFISGQIPVTVDGQVPADFESQCRLAWQNVLAQLNAAGMEVKNLVKVTTFLSSREYAELNSSIRRELLGDHSPALTIIITGIFDESWLLEIEAIAAG